MAKLLLENGEILEGKSVGYKGDFTLEADTFLSAYTAENVAEGVKKMADCVGALAEDFNKLA